MQQNHADESTLEALRREIQVGIDCANRGELCDGEEYLNQMLQELHRELEARAEETE
ncbi:MAG: hypothetical protein ACK47B_13815 [Armatimonadota bacterium]